MKWIDKTRFLLFLASGHDWLYLHSRTSRDQRGASYEHAAGKIYALDFQPNIDLDPAIRYLEGLQEQGLLVYRISEYS